MISPVQFRDIIYPGLKAVMGGNKNLGLLTIKHTDGNIKPLIDMIIDSDIDCLDPIDPLAGMDLKLIKKMYGDKISVKGNVDCAHTLTFKSIEETVEETKQALK
jgi:uroporphyrinogen decarboxylase